MRFLIYSEEKALDFNDADDIQKEVLKHGNSFKMPVDHLASVLIDLAVTLLLKNGYGRSIIFQVVANAIRFHTK